MSDLQLDDSLIDSIRKACSGSVENVRQALGLKTNSVGIYAALEIARAAERTFQLAEQAKSLVESRAAIVRNRILVDTTKLSDYSSPYFTEFVADPSLVLLTCVRAMERISMVLCKYEAESINAAIRTPRNLANMKSLGSRPADILCREGVFFYGVAALQLTNQGQDHGAQLLNGVSGKLHDKLPDIKGGFPADVIQKIGMNYRLRHEASTRLHYETKELERPSVDLLVKLVSAFDHQSFRPVPTFVPVARHKLGY